VALLDLDDEAATPKGDGRHEWDWSTKERSYGCQRRRAVALHSWQDDRLLALALVMMTPANVILKPRPTTGSKCA
jgi:hypothetical protein